MNVETLRRLWELAMAAGEYDLAHEVQMEINERTIAKFAKRGGLPRFKLNRGNHASR